MDGPTLVFRIGTTVVAHTDEGPVRTGRVEWVGSTSRSIREAVEESLQEGEARSATAEAAEWLKDYLFTQGGVAESADIKREGAKAGHSIDALKRARRRLGAKVEGRGFPKRTCWNLPSVGAKP